VSGVLFNPVSLNLQWQNHQDVGAGALWAIVSRPVSPGSTVPSLLIAFEEEVNMAAYGIGSWHLFV
jgi:hypothetical protein